MNETMFETNSRVIRLIAGEVMSLSRELAKFSLFGRNMIFPWSDFQLVYKTLFGYSFKTFFFGDVL